ncbi:Enzymatic poly, partial [Paramuricea clavata]
TAVNVVYRPEPDITIRTDASKQGWGCAVNDLATGGLWTVEEQEDHINYLEMLAVLFGLKAYKQLVSDKHVKVLVDNTTVQVTLNKMGTSHSPKLNALVKSIWDWCIIHHIWLTVARIPGKENIEADYESRKCRRNTEWCLDKKLFHKACEKLHFMPNIDLFASRINYQYNQSGSPENSEGTMRRTYSCAKVAHTDMVASCYENACSETSAASNAGIHIISTQQTNRKAPSPSQNVPVAVSLIRKQLENRGFSQTVTNVMDASWRSGTRKQYECYLSKWELYCSERKIDPFYPALEDGINFLGELYDQGTGYSGLNTARSALSSIIVSTNNG